MRVSCHMARKAREMTKTIMTEEQENHCARLVADFAVAFTDKYRTGQEEHGGNLWEKDPAKMVKEAKAEVLDQWAYLDNLERNIAKMQARIAKLEGFQLGGGA